MLSKPDLSDGSSEAEFDELERQVSVRHALAGHSIRFSHVVVGVPVGVYLLGLGIAFATGWGRSYLADPVPPVFAIATFLFLEGVRTFDRRFFDMIRDIESAFAEPPERFYGFFSALAERLYEPWPTAERPVAWTHPTRLVYLGLLGYVVLLAVTGIGNPPANRPWPNIAFFWGMTVVGLAEAVVLLWTVYVMFAYMAIHVTELDIALDPLRASENLGLEPYGTFVVSITSRIFVVLAVGGFALFTNPSAFTVTLFIGGIVLFVAWFVSTQYGLHVAILESKDRYRDTVRDLFEGDGVHQRLTDDPDFESVRNARDGTEYVRHLDSLPDWPVTWKNLLRLVGSVVLTLLSVLTELGNLLPVVFS